MSVDASVPWRIACELVPLKASHAMPTNAGEKTDATLLQAWTPAKKHPLFIECLTSGERHAHILITTACWVRSTSLWVYRDLFWRLSRDRNSDGSGMSHATTASPEPSFKAPWRVGDAVVGRGNAGWTTSKSGHPCPCQICSQGPSAEKTGRGSLLNRPSRSQNDPIGHGAKLIWTEGRIIATRASPTGRNSIFTNSFLLLLLGSFIESKHLHDFFIQWGRGIIFCSHHCWLGVGECQKFLGESPKLQVFSAFGI